MFIGDVSSHNNVTDWAAYIRDTPAVWAKATQASGSAAYTSPLFVGQFAGARAAGGLVGAYHFADSRFSPAADFGHFFDVAGPVGAFDDGALLPMLDVEDTTGVTWTAGNVNTWVAGFITAYRQRTGQRKIIIYASRSFWQTIMRPDDWADADVYLMVAAYPGSVDWANGLNQSGYSHPRLAVWQYTDAAPVAGMQGLGDRSRQVAFTQADLTPGSKPPAPGPDDEGDDDMPFQQVLFLAEADPNVNKGEPLYPHGVWRNDQGVYVGLVSSGPNSEQESLLGAFPEAKTAWVSQATLAEWVRISRVGVDTPPPSAAVSASN
jgi:GH25 family lysozyme M1 (1,4-beta-N-acetylmuramidase)